MSGKGEALAPDAKDATVADKIVFGDGIFIQSKLNLEFCLSASGVAMLLLLP